MILKRVLSFEFTSSLLIALIILLLWKRNHKVSKNVHEANSGIAVTEYPQRSSVHLKSVSQNEINETPISVSQKLWVSKVLRAIRSEDEEYVSVEEAMKLVDSAMREYRVKTKPPSQFSRRSRKPRRSTRNESLLSCGYDCEADRIIKQLQFVPDNASNIKKKICLKHWPREEVYPFEDLKCPVSSCRLLHNCENAEADAIVFRDKALKILPKKHPPEQVWILFTLESPASPVLYQLDWRNIQVNWTASYNRDSDIVTPYGYWVNYKDSDINQINISRKINYAENKTGQVIWIVSHCLSANYREKYVEELKKYINVDIYGRCGEACDAGICPVEQYKFYLAFENSNCKDYITEKLFLKGYERNVLPIVMGARPEDYARVAPPHSYIHVNEFASPRDMADYLQLLDSDDQLYNSYFQWKGTGEFLKTSIWCRMCALLHADYPAKWYDGKQWFYHRYQTCFNTSFPTFLSDLDNPPIRRGLIF